MGERGEVLWRRGRDEWSRRGYFFSAFASLSPFDLSFAYRRPARSERREYALREAVMERKPYRKRCTDSWVLRVPGTRFLVSRSPMADKRKDRLTFLHSGDSTVPQSRQTNSPSSTRSFCERGNESLVSFHVNLLTISAPQTHLLLLIPRTSITLRRRTDPDPKGAVRVRGGRKEGVRLDESGGGVDDAAGESGGDGGTLLLLLLLLEGEVEARGVGAGLRSAVGVRRGGRSSVLSCNQRSVAGESRKR